MLLFTLEIWNNSIYLLQTVLYYIHLKYNRSRNYSKYAFLSSYSFVTKKSDTVHHDEVQLRFLTLPSMPCDSHMDQLIQRDWHVNREELSQRLSVAALYDEHVYSKTRVSSCPQRHKYIRQLILKYFVIVDSVKFNENQALVYWSPSPNWSLKFSPKPAVQSPTNY